MVGSVFTICSTTLWARLHAVLWSGNLGLRVPPIADWFSFSPRSVGIIAFQTDRSLDLLLKKVIICVIIHVIVHRLVVVRGHRHLSRSFRGGRTAHLPTMIGQAAMNIGWIRTSAYQEIADRFI